MQAETVNNKALLARTVTGSDGKLGIGAAVDYTNDTTNALVDGNVIVKGNADVLADETKNGVNVRTLFVLPSFLSGVQVTSVAGNTSTQNLLTDAQKSSLKASCLLR